MPPESCPALRLAWRWWRWTHEEWSVYLNSAGVQRSTNVYIKSSKRLLITPIRAIFSSAHRPSSQGTHSQGFNTSQWKQFYPKGRVWFWIIMRVGDINIIWSTFGFPSTEQNYLKAFHLLLKGKKSTQRTFVTLQAWTYDINFKEILPSLEHSYPQPKYTLKGTKRQLSRQHPITANHKP